MPFISFNELAKIIATSEEIEDTSSLKPLFWIDNPAHEDFPDPINAWDNHSPAPGLIALSPFLDAQLTLKAYHKGIFPWFIESGIVNWFSPDPRMVLKPKQIQIRRSFKKRLKQFLDDPKWVIKVDHGFDEVIRSCAQTPRTWQKGTWITASIIKTYTELYRMGYAHSVSCWYDQELMGGLYGIGIGRMFYGESMFSRANDVSKIALTALCAFLDTQNVHLIDCQQETQHLAFMGAAPMARQDFYEHLQTACYLPPITHWAFDKTILCHIIEPPPSEQS